MALITKKKIVILGGGFGGLKAAFLLSKKLTAADLLDKYELILVDKNSYHTYYPTLYEIATTSKNLASEIKLKEITTFSFTEIFENKPVSFLQKTVSELDLIEGDIHFFDGGKLGFDYLILALGSETNYFDIPGLKENSFALKSFLDAIRIRDEIWNKIESNQSKSQLKIVIGGGGSTGVELAGEIKSWLCQLEKEFKECLVSLKIIEAGPTILPGFNEKIINKVTQRLRKIGVEIALNEAIEKVDKSNAVGQGKIILKSGRIENFDILIWTGGTKAVSLMAALPLKKEKRGRAEVAGQMECLPQSEDLKLYGKIYGLGDSICFYNPETNRPIPQIAEAAIEQGKIAAHNIMEEIFVNEGFKKQARIKKYIPQKEYAYIIPIGGKYAVAKVGPIVFSGLGGWILKGLVELYYLLWNVLPPSQAIKIWLKGLKIFIQNDRLG